MLLKLEKTTVVRHDDFVSCHPLVLPFSLLRVPIIKKGNSRYYRIDAKGFIYAKVKYCE